VPTFSFLLQNELLLKFVNEAAVLGDNLGLLTTEPALCLDAEAFLGKGALASW